ncbi:MAG TPA: hypothetical protein VFZ28_08480 [Burkholderiaceae bacterium]|nr:hypothetical protein [Burkholderiaceae bacterium]
MVGIEKPARSRSHRSTRALGSSKSTRFSGRNGSAASGGGAGTASTGADAAAAAIGAGAASADDSGADTADTDADADADADAAGAAAGVAGGTTDAAGFAGAGASLGAAVCGVGGVTAQPTASATTASAAPQRSRASDRVDGRRLEAVIDKASAKVRQASCRLPACQEVAGSRALSVHLAVAHVTEFTRWSGPDRCARCHRSERDSRS